MLSWFRGNRISYSLLLPIPSPSSNPKPQISNSRIPPLHIINFITGNQEATWVKRYIDQGWEQRRRGRRWLTTRRGTHLRSIIGIVLGETGAIGARGGCYRGGGIRARHGYPLSSRLLLEGEARRSSFSKTRCLVMDLAHYRPTASFSKRFTFTPRRTRAFLELFSLPSQSEGREMYARLVISRIYQEPRCVSI